MKRAIALLGGVVLAGAANAAPVDLSSWIVEEVPGSPTANWTVQNAPANDSVFQSQNSRPSIFFDPGTNSQGKALSGKIKVETASDDDFIGFVLGYDSGEAGSNNTDFILIDWKQGNQPGGGCFGNGLAGLSVSRVTAAASECSFWGHDSGIVAGVSEVTEIARATNLGATGWADNTEYDFELVFTANLIQVSVDGVLELSINPGDAGIGSFDDGAFGFYNYSQASVRYSAIEEDPAPVPEPVTLLLLGLGLAAVSLTGRRRQR